MTKRLILVGIALAAGGMSFAEDGWVQSDGTQYVDTGYRPTPKTKIVADFAYVDVTTLQQRVFGESGGNAGITFSSYINGGGNYAWAVQNHDGNWQSTDVKATADRRRITLDCPASLATLETWQVDGSWTKARSDQTMTTARTLSARLPLYIFANNYSGTVGNFGKVRLYGLRIFEDGVLVRDYVPFVYGGRAVLKEAVSATYCMPAVGHALTSGGDVATDAYTGALTWTGANGADWNDVGNWSAGGASATHVPAAGDAVAIDTSAGSVTLSCANLAQVPASVSVTGGGTVTFTAVPAGRFADALTVAAGAQVAVRGETPLYVGAANVAGSAVASARYDAGASWISAGSVNVNYSGSSVVDNVLTLDVAAGQTVTYSAPLAASLTKVVKLGAGRAVVTNDANATFTGVTEVRGGVLEIQSAQIGIIPTLGNKKENTITVFDGAQLYVNVPAPPSQGNKRFNNQFVISGYGPDGTGALRFYRSCTPNNQYNCDSMFSDVLLAGDALVSSPNSRFGFGGGTVDCGGHVLDLFPNTQGQVMINGGTWKNGHLKCSGYMNPIAQNENTFSGGSDNTFTLEPGVTFGFWGPPLTFDWTLVAKGGSALSLGAGTSDTMNNLAGPVTLTDGTVFLRTYEKTANMRQHLKGKISGAGSLQKESHHFVFLDHEANDFAGGVKLNGSETGGLVAKYPGSVPAAAPVTLTCGVLAYDPANWQGSDVKALAERATYSGNATAGGFIAPYLAANAEHVLAQDFAAPVQIGSFNAGTFTYTGRLADGSVLRNNGGTFNVAGDNDGVVLGGLHLRRGTTVFSGTGYLNWTNNYCTVGQTNNAAPCRVVVKDGAALARFVPSAGGYTQEVRIQDGGSKGAILSVLAGGAVTNKIQTAFDGGTIGALYVDGGSVCTLSREANDGHLGASGYGFTGVYAGTYDIVGWLGIGTGTDGVGVFEQTGGTVKVRNQGFAPSRGGTARVRFSGGTFTNPNDYIRMGEQQWGQKGRTSGTAVLTVDGTASVSAGGIAIVERTNVFTSVVNFNGGVFAGACVRKADWEAGKRTAEAKGYVNFDGGTFRATASAEDYYRIFGADIRVVDCVRVNAKGATIDTNGKKVTNGSVPFTAPTGKGVAKITIPSGTVLTDQIGSPEVVITGDGQGATAWCAFDHATGKIGGIVVTSPGWGYTTATATIKLGNRSKSVTCPVTLADNVASGGLTVSGGGTFRLDGTSNTYGGETFVTNATLVSSEVGSLPAGSAVRLSSGTLDLNGKTQTVPTIGGSGVVRNGGLVISDCLTFDAATAQDKATSLVFEAAVTLPDSIRITNADALDPDKAAGVLATFATPLAKAPAVDLPSPWRAFLTDGGRTLKFGYQQATVLVLR